MSIFKSLKFGNIDSADYGIYITGEAVYNAPVRAVEMVNVAGRNGAIIVDQGRWENIEVTYPAGTFADSQGNFATAMSSFRNAIVSQIGYQRLTDDYHPEEYRMATYIDGLEVEPVQYGTAGEFEIRFNCKPQRWLVSGEEDISVTSGASIPNPTLYEASPLIKAEGYGTINLGDYEVEIANALMGEVVVANAGTTGASPYTQHLSSELFNSGDSITVSETTSAIKLTRKNTSITFNSVSSVTGGTIQVYSSGVSIQIPVGEMSITAGTDTSDTTTCSGTLSYSVNGSSYTASISATVRRVYSPNNITWSFTSLAFPSSYMTISGRTLRYGRATADSTVSILGTPTYLDCDLGVCYKIENDEVIDLNPYIDLGSLLPALEQGSNLVTYDNTITSLIIVPRWWQL